MFRAPLVVLAIVLALAWISNAKLLVSIPYVNAATLAPTNLTFKQITNDASRGMIYISNADGIQSIAKSARVSTVWEGSNVQGLVFDPAHDRLYFTQSGALSYVTMDQAVAQGTLVVQCPFVIDQLAIDTTGSRIFGLGYASGVPSIATYTVATGSWHVAPFGGSISFCSALAYSAQPEEVLFIACGPELMQYNLVQHTVRIEAAMKGQPYVNIDHIAAVGFNLYLSTSNRTVWTIDLQSHALREFAALSLFYHDEIGVVSNSLELITTIDHSRLSYYDLQQPGLVYMFPQSEQTYNRSLQRQSVRQVLYVECQDIDGDYACRGNSSQCNGTCSATSCAYVNCTFPVGQSCIYNDGGSGMCDDNGDCVAAPASTSTSTSTTSTSTSTGTTATTGTTSTGTTTTGGGACDSSLAYSATAGTFTVVAQTYTLTDSSSTFTAYVVAVYTLTGCTIDIGTVTFTTKGLIAPVNVTVGVPALLLFASFAANVTAKFPQFAESDVLDTVQIASTADVTYSYSFDMSTLHRTLPSNDSYYAFSVPGTGGVVSTLSSIPVNGVSGTVTISGLTSSPSYVSNLVVIQAISATTTTTTTAHSAAPTLATSAAVLLLSALGLLF